MSSTGKNSSFAGSESKNDRNTTPSKPSARPMGSRASAQAKSTGCPPACTWESPHNTAPAGAANAAARDSTCSVRCKNALARTFPTCGTRYGGSSSTNAEGTPRKRVFDKSHEAASVASTPTASTADRASATAAGCAPPEAPAERNIVKSASIVGKRPLHGTNAFVKTAKSRSRGESRIRQPMTPTALQPIPMHIVSACLPQAWQA